MNAAAVAIIAVLAVGLLAFLYLRNQQDKKVFEEQVKNDYHKTKDAENDTDDSEPPVK